MLVIILEQKIFLAAKNKTIPELRTIILSNYYSEKIINKLLLILITKNIMN